MSTVPPPAPSEEPRRPFQFSMATLMAVMTVVAVGLGILFALPVWVGLLIASTMSLAWIAFLIAGAFFAKSMSQTFCIGALGTHFFSVIGYYSIPNIMTDNLEFLGAGAGIVSMVVIDSFAGWVCVRARRFWERRNS